MNEESLKAEILDREDGSIVEGVRRTVPVLVGSGWLRVRVRDEDGCLVPLEIPKLAYHGDDCPGHTTEPPGESCFKREG